MELEFIYRIVIANLIAAAALSGAVGIGYGMYEAAGIMAGALWGSLNLVLIKNLAVNCLKIKESHPLKVFLSLMIKFPLVYCLGVGLLLLFSYQSLLVGFSLLFVVMLGLAIRLCFQLKNSHKGKLG